VPDMDGLISKLQDATFARGFVEGMRRDAADLGGRIAELEAALRLSAAMHTPCATSPAKR